MEIQQLRYFVHAACCSSFREAAEGLFVTRAALGKAISTLEAELGQPLFDRSRDGVCPTAFAASYLNQARALVDDFDRLAAAMKGDVRIPEVHLCIPTSWYGHFADRVDACRAAFAGRVEVLVESCTDAECVRRFSSGAAELVVTHIPLKNAYDEGLLLLRTPLYIAMSERNPLAVKEELTIEDLFDQDIFYYTCGFDQVWWVPTVGNGRGHFDNDLMHIYACVHRNKKGFFPRRSIRFPSSSRASCAVLAPKGSTTRLRRFAILRRTCGETRIFSRRALRCGRSWRPLRSRSGRAFWLPHPRASLAFQAFGAAAYSLPTRGPSPASPQTRGEAMSITRSQFVKGAATGIVGTGLAAATAWADEPTQAPAARGMTAADWEGTWSFEIAPEPITDFAQTYETELIVVGEGYSGLCCACSAAQRGVKTMIVTGSTAPTCRGGSNNATYSRVMEAAGIAREDFDIENVYQEEMITANSGRVDMTKWSRYANSSEEAMNWVLDIVEARGYSACLEGCNTDPDDPRSPTTMFPASHCFISEDLTSAGIGQIFAVNSLEDEFKQNGGEVFNGHVARQLTRGGVANGTEGRVDGVIARNPRRRLRAVQGYQGRGACHRRLLARPRHARQVLPSGHRVRGLGQGRLLG